MYRDIKVIAMDLDGTLTQHRTPLDSVHRNCLIALSQKYKLLMVGAGQVMRIFNQMEQFPIEIIGNYGMQYGVYEQERGVLTLARDVSLPCPRAQITEKVNALREKYGYTAYAGESVEFHPSGCITFPLLGTKAAQKDKLAFDPDRSKRRKIYEDVVNTFPDYCVFVGGSSSFDMAPKPYDKYHALDAYCKENGLSHRQVLYIGDDYGLGGNDESVYRSDFPYITIDCYQDFPEKVRPLLSLAYWTQSDQNIYVAAHRGWRSKYPENTMEAFRTAIELGVDQLETDIRITKDGQLVLIHDATVDRTTNGTGKVCDLTLAQLKELDAGGGTKIPTLTELMDLVRDHPTLTLDLELKEYPEDVGDLAYRVCDRVLKMVDDYGFTDRCVINSFRGSLHDYIRSTYGSKYRQHVFYPRRHLHECALDPYSYAYCACIFGLISGETTAADARALYAQTGVRIWAGAYVKDEETVTLAQEMGAELITCDNPDEILAILRSRNLHK